MSEQTRALLISPIRFDKELQKCYNLCVSSDVVTKRIAERRTIQNIRRQSQKPSGEREMSQPRLSPGELILSNRKNGFLLF